MQLHRLALAVEGQVGIDHAAANGFDHAVQLCIDLGIAGLFMEHPAQGGDKDQRPGLGQGGLQGVRLFQQGGKRGDFCRFFVHAQQRLQRAALGLGELRLLARAGLLGQAGAGKDQQQALRLGLGAGDAQQVVKVFNRVHSVQCS